MKYDINLPRCSSPFFIEELERSEMCEHEKDLCRKFHNDGYFILDLENKI